MSKLYVVVQVSQETRPNYETDQIRQSLSVGLPYVFTDRRLANQAAEKKRKAGVPCFVKEFQHSPLDKRLEALETEALADAEHIRHLEGVNDELRAENAKLRRRLEILRDHGIEIVDAAAGGFEIYSKDHALVDQLRELARDMMRYYFTPSALDRRREVELTERARELGVEEDDGEHCSELGIEVDG